MSGRKMLILRGNSTKAGTYPDEGGITLRGQPERCTCGPRANTRGVTTMNQ